MIWRDILKIKIKKTEEYENLGPKGWGALLILGFDTFILFPISIIKNKFSYIMILLSICFFILFFRHFYIEIKK